MRCSVTCSPDFPEFHLSCIKGITSLSDLLFTFKAFCFVDSVTALLPCGTKSYSVTKSYSGTQAYSVASFPFDFLTLLPYRVSKTRLSTRLITSLATGYSTDDDTLSNRRSGYGCLFALTELSLLGCLFVAFSVRSQPLMESTKHLR